MKLSYILLFGFVFLFSCKSHDDDHLSRQKMQLILADMHDAENYSTMAFKDTVKTDGRYRLPQKNMDSLAHYYRMILAHYQLSVNEFNKNIKWYSAHPDDLDSVYVDLINTYSKLEKN